MFELKTFDPAVKFEKVAYTLFGSVGSTNKEEMVDARGEVMVAQVVPPSIVFAIEDPQDIYITIGLEGAMAIFEINLPPV